MEKKNLSIPAAADIKFLKIGQSIKITITMPTDRFSVTALSDHLRNPEFANVTHSWHLVEQILCVANGVVTLEIIFSPSHTPGE